MKKQPSVLHRILHPPKPLLFLLPPVVFSALVFLFLSGQNDHPAAYVVYGMSAYCLTVLILAVPGAYRTVKNAVMQSGAARRITHSGLGDRYLHDADFRGCVSLCRGTAVNFLYVLFRLTVGILYASVWSVSMALYYLVLGALRLSLIVGYRRRGDGRGLRRFRRTAWLLFLLNIPMGVMIFLMIRTDAGFSYPGYVIYLSAMYTFYAAAHSVADLLKYRALRCPVLSAAKVLNFTAALMSVLGLQTAMITSFSAESGTFRQSMNTVTGTAVWFAVILTAVGMLLYSKKFKKEENPPE